MTLLRGVRIYLNTDDFDALASDFLFRSCYLSNFESRCARQMSFNTTGFSQILVQGRSSLSGGPRITVESNLIVPVLFDQARYEFLGPGEHHEFFIGMLSEGLQTCARHHRIPFDELMASIGEFRRLGYRNEWIHQKRLLRPFGLTASLVCRLDSERFALNLMLTRKDSVMFDQQILETKPDELMFAHRFKEVALEGEAIVVKDKRGRSLFSLEARSLG